MITRSPLHQPGRRRRALPTQKAAEEKGPLASRFKAHPTFLVVSTCCYLELHSKFKLGGCPRNVSQVPGCNPQKHHLPSPKQRPFTLVHWERLLRLPLSPPPALGPSLPPLPHSTRRRSPPCFAGSDDERRRRAAAVLLRAAPLRRARQCRRRPVGAAAGTAKWLIEICVEPGFSGFFWVELIGGIALCV